VKRATGLALGILAGIGGFVDMGGIITSSQAGASYRYALLWTVIPGIIGFAVYADMSGRIAISTGRTTFDVIRDRLGGRVALYPLLATVVVDGLTLVVELAGMALAIRIGLQLPTAALAGVCALALLVVLWRAGVEVLDNTAAILGLCMLVSVVAMVKLHPAWGHVGASLVHPDVATSHPAAAYLFSAVSLLGAYMTPYQFEFYSSGALEQNWTGDDLLTNRVSAILGTSFGGVVTVALMVVAAAVLFPRHQDVKTLLDAAAGTKTALGRAGLAIFAVGTFAVSAGAGIETSLSGAYSVCQFFGWDWGKRQRPREVPVFFVVIASEVVLAAAIVASGLDPIRITVITMAFAAFTLPFTFAPLLIVANDREYVDHQRNTRMANVVAALVLVLLCIVTLATIPLLILSGGGQ
jgi:Mn2+/Fe2+ NRAMP family transporter